jgi:hypothetical protein
MKLKLSMDCNCITKKKIKAGTPIEIIGMRFDKFCETKVMLQVKRGIWLDSNWFVIERINFDI